MKNRKLLILTLFLCLMIISGCENRETITNEEYIVLSEQKSFGSGLVVKSEMVEDYSVIYYYDYTGNNEVYACSQANCSHNVADYKSGKINCNALVKGEVKYPFIYNEKLYYFVAYNNKAILWQSEADGTDKEKIVETDFKLYPGSFVMADGCIYVSSDVTEEIDYDEQSASAFTIQSEVYEIDIRDKEIKKLTNFGKKPTSICRGIQYFDNKLYIKYSCSDKTYKQAAFFKDDEDYYKWMVGKNFSYAEDIKRFGKKENYYTYDLETEKIGLLDIDFESNFVQYKGIDNMDSYYIICVNGSKIYYLDPVVANYTLYSYDLDSKERKEIISKYQISSSYKDGKIYITSVDMDKSTKNELIPSVDLNSAPKYYIFDVDTEKLVEQDYGKNGKFYYVADVNEDGLLAYETVFDERYNFIDEHGFYEIPKNEIK